jgi:hypothetical protein
VDGVSGDPDNVDSIFDILLEGQPFILGTPNTANRFITGTATVTVSDGRLTLSNGPTGANNKINFLDIYALPTATEGATLVVTRVAGGIKIDWAGGGMLQSKTDLNTGAWVDINNSGSYTESTASGNKFFRVVR